ncbi:MAG: hypothetical protein SGILL_005756 [Bacillariaceae sp.]
MKDDKMMLGNSSTTSESQSGTESPCSDETSGQNCNAKEDGNSSLSSSEAVLRQRSTTNGSNPVMTRHRKSLLRIHNDLEDGRSIKHSVPDPKTNRRGNSVSGSGSQSGSSNNSSHNTITNHSVYTNELPSSNENNNNRYNRNASTLSESRFPGGAPERWVEKHRRSCSNKSCNDWITTFLPIYGWLRTYQWKQWLGADILCGLTVGAMVVPQSLSYAKLAGLPVQFGLYSSLVPIYAYALFGTSRQLAVGPVALVSLLLSAGLTMILEGEGITPENTNPDDYEAMYSTMALQVSFLVGVMYLLMGCMKLGFIANFLSHAVISGFTSAAAIIIGLSQVKYIFGYTDIPNDKTLHKQLYNIFANLDQFNWKTFVLGTSCVMTLVGLKRLAQAYPKRFKWTRAAGPLLVTAVAIVLQATLDLQARGIPIVGYIPQGLPDFTGSIVFPLDFGRLAIVVLSIVIVGFMESIAIAKKLAQTHNYELDANMELIGLGMANLSSGLFGGYPVTGSFSRSAVNNDVGAKSGISALVTATLVAMTLLFLTSVFELLALATLASIVISGVLSLVDLDEAKYLWRVHKFDFCVWLAAFLGTLFLGVELGLGIAIAISLLIVLYESAYPPTAVLGRLPGTHQYRNIKQYPDVQTYDGIVCIRVDSAIYFANSQHVRDKVQKYYLRAEAGLAADRGEAVQSLHHDVPPKVQFIIMELSPVSHIDTSALHMLQEMASSLKKANDIQICLANPNPRVMHRLVSCGLADEIGRDHIFVSLHDAVDYCLHHMDKKELERHYESNMSLDQLLPFQHEGGDDDNQNDATQIDDLIKSMEPSSVHNPTATENDNTTATRSSTMKTTSSSARMLAVASENTIGDLSARDFDVGSGEDIEVGLEQL